MGYNSEASMVKLQEVFEKNRNFIFNNWIALVINNLKLNSDLEFMALLKIFKYIIDNFISYLKTSNMKEYISRNINIAELMVTNRISYKIFMQGINYFQESYIQALVINLEINTVSQCLVISNRIFTRTITDISDEYHNIKDSTLTALVKLSELRDDTTGSHVERTKDYAITLSISLNLDDSFIKDMSKASLLHDIGKVAIKDEILLKPTALTLDEFEQIKRHTIIGAETIDKVINTDTSTNGYLVMAKSIALCHHEKFNGTGYPNNLVGKDIPLSARVFALADAYDVITSKRPYKKAENHKEAIRRIIVSSGSHFDPDIVTVFLKVQHEFESISEDYKSKLIQQ